MKKISLSLALICLCSYYSSGQLLVSKLIGKDAEKYGLGFGIFGYLDFPLRSGNQSIRVELAEIAYYPAKGGGFFTSPDGKGYVSFKLGYKYVFSETQTGFYVIPSAGLASVMLMTEDLPEADDAWGYAAAFESGYSLEIGERGHAINLGLKYEYNYAKKTHVAQSLGLRLSYSFGLFQRSYY